MAAKKAKESKVPNLRFPGFEGEWVESNFGEVCQITTGNKNTQDKVVNGKYPFFVRSSIIERINSYTFDGEAILTAGDGVGVGKVFHYSVGKIGVHQRVYILSSFRKCNGKFLYFYFSSKFYNRVKTLSAKNSVDSVRRDMIAKMPLSYPSPHEQNKISGLLQLLSSRIATQSKIIEELKSLQGALVYNLFFKSFSSNKWNAYTYNDLFTISTKKNIENAIHNILSASQAMGMVERNEIEIDIKFDEKSVRSYKIVEPGDYVIHLRSFQGGIAFSDKRGICSPAYTILRPKTLLEYSFLKEYFRSKKFIQSLKLVTYGIRDGRSISIEEFLKLKISIPSRDNQSKILAIVSAMNKKIYLNIKIQELLLKQKQYLLQNMFI